MEASTQALIQDPKNVAAVLLTFLAILFACNRTALGQRVFRVIPLLVFAYFVPTLLSNTGVIPIESPLYSYIKYWLLPASLLLLTLSVDIPAIIGLGRPALILFLAATASIVLGGPLAYLIVGLIMPDVAGSMGDQAWRGLAALSGSWIGGGANFVAIGESAGATSSTIGMMVVVDVAVANVWMAVLLWFAGREKAMDEKIGADRAAIEELKTKISTFQSSVARPTNLPDLLIILALGIGGSAVARAITYGFKEFGWSGLPPIGDFISQFTWVVIIVTTLGVGLSFTRFRKLEGSGASAVGSVLIYFLVTSIGAHADFSQIGKVPGLLIVGAVWMLIHVIIILLVRRAIRAPIFFAAVGSKANIGGAASAPIVASAFHPSLATVGVLLAVGGYVLGTYAGLLCMVLLRAVHGILYGAPG